jgi:hypothetical protein
MKSLRDIGRTAGWFMTAIVEHRCVEMERMCSPMAAERRSLLKHDQQPIRTFYVRQSNI